MLFELLLLTAKVLFVVLSEVLAADEFANFSTTAFNNPLRLFRGVEDKLLEILVVPEVVFFLETKELLEVPEEPLNAATIAGSIPPKAAIAIVAASKLLEELDELPPLKNGIAAAMAVVIALLLLLLLFLDWPNEVKGFNIDVKSVGFVAISAASAVSARKFEAALFPRTPVKAVNAWFDALDDNPEFDELFKLHDCWDLFWIEVDGFNKVWAKSAIVAVSKFVDPPIPIKTAAAKDSLVELLLLKLLKLLRPELAAKLFAAVVEVLLLPALVLEEDVVAVVVPFEDKRDAYG